MRCILYFCIFGFAGFLCFARLHASLAPLSLPEIGAFDDPRSYTRLTRLGVRQNLNASGSLFCACMLGIASWIIMLCYSAFSSHQGLDFLSLRVRPPPVTIDLEHRLFELLPITVIHWMALILLFVTGFVHGNCSMLVVASLLFILLPEMVPFIIQLSRFEYKTQGGWNWLR